MRFVAHLLFSLPLVAWYGCTPLDSESDTAKRVLGAGLGAEDDEGGENEEDAGKEDAGVLPGSGDWSCLRNKAVTFDGSAERIQYIVGIVDFDSQPPPVGPSVVEDLSITVCGSPSCDPPFSEPDVIVKQIEEMPPYVWMIDFPYNFSNGYLQLRAPGYAPMDYVFGGPMKGLPDGSTVVYGLTIPLLKESTRDTIYNDLGLSGTADLTRGVLALRTLDCGRNPQGQGVRAKGVRLGAIPQAPPAPAVAWTLSFSNRATPNKLETDARGVAGFVNMLPGSVDVEGIAPVGGGTPYGRTTLAVRPGVITLGELRDGLDIWGQ